jgi:flagellar biosynthetic protein FliR
MRFESAEIAAWVGSFVWPLVRIAALVSVAPVFGSRLLPRRLRLILVVVLTWTVLPFIPPVPAVEPVSPASLLITAQQVLIGMSMGFMLRLVFGALEVGGQIIAMQMGLSFASSVDPQNGAQLPLLSHFYTLIGTLAFLALDGHLMLIQVLVESFRTLPVATLGLHTDALWTLAGWASQMFGGAVLIALPAIASLMVVNLAFGVITRATPQFNIFAVGFPISLLLGLFIILYSLPTLLPQLERLLDAAFQTTRQLLAAGAG